MGTDKKIVIIYEPHSLDYHEKDVAEAEADLDNVIRYILQVLMPKGAGSL